MGCRREKIKKLLLIGIITAILTTSTTPLVKIAIAATDTVDVTFNPQGNLSVSVTPTSWDADSNLNGGGNSYMYTGQSNSTSGNYFTASNDGTLSWSRAYIQAANTASMTVVDSSPSTDEFSMEAYGGDLTSWTGVATNRTLEDDIINPSGSVTFDLNVTMGTVFTDEYGEQTCTISITVIDTDP
ncbi:MAG: hypothetical protein KKC68_07815 [Candidatus Thermoplasmatota archaeon]|nr:hypothetical protein [Candidatus Thermoplasmatota archaeon]MBU1941664.1 hypothetical protein [Candidatus Thermoplasmatota archaeon]